MQASVSLGWRLRWLDLVQVSGDLCERPAQDPLAVLQRREVVRRRDLPHRREVPVQRRLPRLPKKCKKKSKKNEKFCSTLILLKFFIIQNSLGD